MDKVKKRNFSKHLQTNNSPFKTKFVDMYMYSMCLGRYVCIYVSHYVYINLCMYIYVCVYTHEAFARKYMHKLLFISCTYTLTYTCNIFVVCILCYLSTYIHPKAPTLLNAAPCHGPGLRHGRKAVGPGGTAWRAGAARRQVPAWVVWKRLWEGTGDIYNRLNTAI